jgi:hypothetical protein
MLYRILHITVMANTIIMIRKLKDQDMITPEHLELREQLQITMHHTDNQDMRVTKEEIIIILSNITQLSN